MTDLRLLHIRSVEELRKSAIPWDDLWRRSDVTVPTARAELLSQWIEHFAADAQFHAYIVEEDGKWRAALPLMKAGVAKILCMATNPGATRDRTWIPSGPFLADAGADLDNVMDLLIHGLSRIEWKRLYLLSFHHIAFEAGCWQAFIRGASRLGMSCRIEEAYPVGLITLDRDWEAFQSHLSRSHRQRMAKASRRLSKEGTVRLQVISRFRQGEVEKFMQRGFEIEDRSWKGQSGSSVLQLGEFPFFLRQAVQLAEWGQLKLAFLNCNDRPIAFSYGFEAKGIYHPYKIGFDPDFQEYSPGQLLFQHLLEVLHKDRQCRAINFVGPLGDTAARWRPDTYMVGHLMVAPQRYLSRLVLKSYVYGWPYLLKIRSCFIRNKE